MLAQSSSDKTLPHTIVVGNEKGGTGKTTTAVHIIVGLMKLGFKVAAIDIDARQRSLSRYIENRQKTSNARELKLQMPDCHIVAKAKQALLEDKHQEETENFDTAYSEAIAHNDFVIIDSPGSDTFLARYAHAHADTVITPVNDSFMDLDVIGILDADSFRVVKPSVYSEMVFQQKISRAGRDGKSIDWIVMRNRLSGTVAKNKKNVEKAIGELSKRLAFRVAPGFNERVIYRELFLNGLTVLDVLDKKLGVSVSMSHVAARLEVRNLLRILGVPHINAKLGGLNAPASDEPAAESNNANEQPQHVDNRVPEATTCITEPFH